MKLSDYDYSLPEELIAQRPIDRRENSRLLVLDKEISHRYFYDIVDYLASDDVLVVNETKVLPAKLLGRKANEKGVEIILYPSSIDGKDCRCRIKGKFREGTVIFVGKYRATVKRKDDDGCDIIFDVPVKQVIDKEGLMPTPPYVKEELKEQDRYQTSYARKIGSIAAPTAGFHFSKELLDTIEKRGVKIVKLTLHVSFGTFTPIRSDDILGHRMEKEFYDIPKEVADTINSRVGRLFVVGTTSLKALESAADQDGKIRAGSGWSDLFLTPAYDYRVKLDGLITNFHLPRSTLLLLVSGLIGREKILDAYEIAVKKNYRFYSFGDSMLIKIHTNC